MLRKRKQGHSVATLVRERSVSAQCDVGLFSRLSARDQFDNGFHPDGGGARLHGQADATISEFTFTQTKGDTVQWQVQAQEARLFEQDKRAMLHDVAVTLFGQQGKELTVTGDEGTLNTETKNFMLANRSEPLVIHTESGYVIYTNHLAWTDQTREIRTQDPVRIVGHGLEVTGRGLLGHLDIRRI